MHLHLFRGFAIICILMVHAYALSVHYAPASMQSHVALTWSRDIVETLLHGSTLFFTLLSGILFSKCLAGRPWTTFFQNKISNVALPYLWVTLLFTLLTWNPDTGWTICQGAWLETLKQAASNTVTGAARFHLWYIPLLAVLYAATPLAQALLSVRRFHGVAIVLILVPLVASRTASALDVTTVLYFFGAYLLGMAIGRHLERVLGFVRTRVSPIVKLTILLSLCILGLKRFGLDWWGDISVQESLFYPQKILITLLVLSALQRHSDRAAWLAPFATYAFPLYFFHLLPMEWALHAIHRPLLSGMAETWVVHMLALATTVASLIGVTFFAHGFKQALGRRSRVLIGA
ncbi:MAG: acyltransferase family protein [Alphaproteobacteria bacterium]